MAKLWPAWAIKAGMSGGNDEGEMGMERILAELQGLTVFRGLHNTEIFAEYCALLRALTRQAEGERALHHYTQTVYLLQQTGNASLGAWLKDWLYYEENSFQRQLCTGLPADWVEKAVRREITTLQRVASLPATELVSKMKEILPRVYHDMLTELPVWADECEFGYHSLAIHYRTAGGGALSRHRAYIWTKGQLLPVLDPDCRPVDQLLGYQMQRNKVIQNTQALVDGHRVNDILLYGDSGTGKSATVKALLTIPGLESLRIIEVQKDGLREIPALMRSLRGHRLPVILFIDDLAFDQDDNIYSEMKSILEGGLERRPANVAIYATSNRRLLMRQTFAERSGDDVDRKETIAEKTALSYRFGLRIPFLGLQKGEYLTLVEKIARQEGVSLDGETLQQEAVKWEARFPGRTPRGARQFVASLLAGLPEISVEKVGRTME